MSRFTNIDPAERAMQMIRKQNERKENIKFAAMIVALALILILVCICIFWSIFAWAKYGSKPVTEIPAWALWFMFKNGGK